MSDKQTKDRFILALVFIMCVMLCGCSSGDSGSTGHGGQDGVPVSDAKEMVKIVVNCSEKDPSVMYRMDFRTGKLEKTVFADEPETTERAYGKQEELKQFVQDRIIPTYGTDQETESSTAKNSDEQKILWNIKITYEDETLIFSSFTKYPDYWTELVRLLEE